MAVAAAAATAAVSPTQQVRCWRDLNLPARLLSLSLLLSLLLSLATAASFGESAPSSSPRNSSTPSLPPPSTRNGQTAHTRSDIIFPDTRVGDYTPRVNGDRPSCAQEGATFCEDGVEDYPTDILNQAMENVVGYREFFANDTIGQNIVDRFGPDDEHFLCGSKEQLIFPKVGQNANGEWLFIINLDSEEYKQGIRVELCQSPGKPCIYASSFPNGVNVACKQKFIYRRIIALKDGGQPKPDTFRMPSCCACYVTSDVQTRTFPKSRSGN